MTAEWGRILLCGRFGGEPRAASDEAIPGQYFDAESGLGYNVNRYYEPAAGRYIQSDPLGQATGQASTYAYVNSSPLNFVDPLGLARTTIDAAIQQALMRGDAAELESILDAAATNEERVAIRAAIDRLKTRIGVSFPKSAGEASIANFLGSIATRLYKSLCRTRTREMLPRERPGNVLTTAGSENEVLYFPHLHGWIVFTDPPPGMGRKSSPLSRRKRRTCSSEG